MIIIPKEEDSDSELIEEKFELLKSVALTESGEKIIPKVITMINTRPDLLKNSIEILINLSKNEMIEIEKIRSILSSKIYKKENEDALEVYCSFLATSVIDEEEEELTVSCAEELWKLRIHPSKKIRSAAFKALSEFSKNFLIETLAGDQENPTSEPLFLSGSQVFSSIDDSTEDEVLDGFKVFLKKCLEIDLENVPRKFFVSNEKIQTDSNLFTSLIPVLRETLQSAEFEWEALSLIDPLTRALMPAGKKSARCEQILTSALTKNNPGIELLKKLVILRNATEVIFNNIMEANASLNKKFGVFE